MKIAHSVKISVFANEGEDRERIKEKLVSLIPLDLEKEKIKIEEKKAQGFNEKEIIIYTVLLNKDRNVNAFLDSFFSKFDEVQKNMLIRQKESRVDDDCNFFIRLDKEKLLNDEFRIIDSGNCFHVKIQIAVFPSRKEAAFGVVEALVGT